MTNELRRIIMDRLNNIKTQYGITEIGYKRVNDDSLYPHIVVDFSSITPTDMGREDFMMDIHVWSKDNATAFEIMDAVRDLFAFWNAPDELVDQMILPTFFEQSNGQVEDPDKTIIHLVLRYQAQVYARSATDRGILGKE